MSHQAKNSGNAHSQPHTRRWCHRLVPDRVLASAGATRRLAGVAIAACASLAIAQDCGTVMGTYEDLDTDSLLDVVGAIAYIESHDYPNIWLDIVDMGDPEAPVRRGRYLVSDDYGRFDEFCIQGSTAYALVEGELHIVDVSDPAAPVQIGSYLTDWPVALDGAMAVHGSMLYAIERHSGEYEYSYHLAVLDVSDPTAVQRLGSAYLSTPEYPWLHSLRVEGNQAYLVRSGGEEWDPSTLMIIDIADPLAPALLSQYGADVINYQIVGPNVYVVNAWQDYDYNQFYSLDTVDISDPSAPTQLATFASTEWLNGFRVVGATGYALGHRSILTLDLGNPLAPEIVGVYDTETNYRNIIPLGRRMYADNYFGVDVLKLYDCSSGDDPCPADFNDDGIVNTRDFVAYLNAWVQGCP